ncbi:MAG: phenylalanine--tRNA ligase subunit beta [PS1 clade bacterium]|uniref:Phenylalanine--tRNA ligase beta subunit n=1 Tax=PS1 clade bacterium TaxID=2175152 RepID=A0A937HH83_9PROT|nr:phenylalanine--tRNA ligase subunit beta [PS1 clade bacterium]
MKFTLSWLHDHLDTEAALEEIVERLTLIGLEVEALSDPAETFANFEVAEIIATEPHPEADRLQICTVKSGGGEQKLVCGAPNARAGLIGILAQQGAVIPSNGMVLGKAKIRGVTSNGMMCSGAELGLSDDHDGIIELQDAPKIGTPAAEALGLADPMIEIGITPNRPDCLGVRGIARDLAASGLGTLKDDKAAPIKADKKAGPAIAVDSDACPVFAGCYIEGVTNAPSPAWLQARLKAIGLNPINALVDITNYISYDRGRPLHVYDADKLSGTVRARAAEKGESFVALDDATYELTPNDCVIADDKGVLGLGGIMGGLASGSTLETKNVLVESAWFDPVSIALSGRHHNIESDARYRFERGVDPASVESGLNLAVQMIVEICGGTVHAPQIGGAVPESDKIVSFAPARVQQLTGLDIAESEMQAVLEKLGFGVTTGKSWRISVPSWRPDIDADTNGADIVEEIVRIHGLDEVPATPLPQRDGVAKPTLTLAQRRAALMRRALAARGLIEAVTWSFISAAQAKAFHVAEGLQLANPISSELSHMRPSLLPGLMAAAARNRDRGAQSINLFELGHEFKAATPGAQRFAAAGLRAGLAAPKNWRGAAHNVDAYQARADAEAALAACGVATDGLQVLPIPEDSGIDWYHPGRSGVLARNPREPMAVFGELHPALLKQFDIDVAAAAFEVWPDAVPAPKDNSAIARAALALSNLQSLSRDFAFEVAGDTKAADMVRAAQAADKKLISQVRVFDVFAGGNLPDGMKSVALEVTLQPRDKTLTDAEIEAVAENVTANVEKATGGKLRG